MPERQSVYLDSHATTPLDRGVLEAMLPFFTEHFGNAASHSHRYGWHAAAAVKKARGQVAEVLGARPTEVVFTSGSTEGINIALQGAAGDSAGQRNHIITQCTEHTAVLECVEALERRGFRVTRLGVDEVGRIDLEELAEALDERTLLVAIMLANNEIGTVQPIQEIGEACRSVGALFFCDLTQGLGWHEVDVDACGIDLAVLSGHKIYGPKGVGALFVRRHHPTLSLSPLTFGGGHERGFRPGTPNVTGNVGLGAACQLASEKGAECYQRVRELRDRLEGRLFAELDGLLLNGCAQNRHPGNLNLAIEGLMGEQLIGAIPEVAVSSGSACTSASSKPSHVIRALGGSESRATSSVRFGLCKINTEEEVDYVADRMVTEVKRLRR